MVFLMECRQRGYLTREDMDGLDLSWGHEEAALEFIHRLAYPETAFMKTAAQGMIPLMGYAVEQFTLRTGKNGARKAIETFAMHIKGLPFSLYRMHLSLSTQGSYAAASDIGAHHAAAWLIKVDLLGAFPTFQDKALGGCLQSRHTGIICRFLQWHAGHEHDMERDLRADG